MNIDIQYPNTNYRLLDSGNGLRLEQFGSNIIIRPDSTCMWKQQKPASLWQQASAICTKDKEGVWSWRTLSTFKEPWFFTCNLSELTAQKMPSLTIQLRFAQSKNIGVFPEQSANWAWMTRIINSVSYSPNVINLFGYTGAATLCAASAGAQVCHVDASKAAITWARANQKLSKLDDAPIRWIVDDCTTFLTREIKRGIAYDALIIDPPAFGRTPKGKPFEFEKHLIQLLELCTKALKPKPLFILFNGYAMGHSATILQNLLLDLYPKQTIECGELHIKQDDSNRTLPCSIYARLRN